MAERLYGFTFNRLPKGTVPVFHEDVVVYEVKDHGQPVGLYYTERLRPVRASVRARG